MVTDDQSPIADYPAVQLFASRARRLRADFALDGQETAVTRLCHLVDGLPLALELAATWIRTLAVPEIVAEIERGLDFLATAVRDVPHRHRSLRAVFNTSWQMLTGPERQAVQQLSVFRGGFDREAAQAVTGASLSLLAALVDKSFMRLDEDGRYRRHPLLIQFAVEKLAADPELETQTRRRHAQYYGRFCQELESHLLGTQPGVGIARLAPEQDMCVRLGIGRQRLGKRPCLTRWPILSCKALICWGCTATSVRWLNMRSKRWPVLMMLRPCWPGAGRWA
ncbi:MAG: hypothetical protein P8183_24550 [Anaerolineae bacterium]